MQRTDPDQRMDRDPSIDAEGLVAEPVDLDDDDVQGHGGELWGG